MTGIVLAAAIALIELHGPSGQVVGINPAEISSVRSPIEDSGRWAEGAHCVIVMTNGRVNAVAEDCDTVMRKANDQK